MKNLPVFFFLLLLSQVSTAQQKTDSLPPVSWPDTINRAQFNEGTAFDPLQLILGKDPGANVFKAGSDPNVPSSLMIRGPKGLYSDSGPLYVIDGIIGGNLFMFPPQELESVIVLKDLAETCFYGSEGTNGVVVVTTKSGNRKKRLSVDFNTAISLGYTKGLSGLFSASEMREKAQAHPEIDFVDGGADTDWQDELFRTAVSQSYQLALGGTSKNTTYRASFDYIGQPGNVEGSGRNMTGGSVAVSQTAFKKKLKIDGLISYYLSNSQTFLYPPEWTSDNLLYQVFMHNPTDPVYIADGSYDQSHRYFQYQNPVALVNMITNEERSKQLSAVLNATWDLWKGLGVKFSGSYSGTNTNTLFDRPANVYPGAWAFHSEGTDKYNRINLLAGLTWKRTLANKHYFDLFAGYVFRTSEQENERISKMYLYPESNYLEKAQYTDNSFRASLNYHFRHKYHLGLVINQEHYKSNVTPEENGDILGWGQWQFYPGITASWDIMREGFMKKIKPVSTLVLKVSYGMAGARPKVDYISETNPGYLNKDLAIETTTEFTAGFDAGFIRNRIMLKMKYYHRNTPNAIVREYLPVPPNFTHYSFQNGMRVTNSGAELGIMVRVIDSRKISWNSILGFNANKNSVVSIEEELSIHSGYLSMYDYILTTASGNSVLAFELPVFIGYDNGRPLYETESGGYSYYSESARREISNTVYPDYIFSWANSFTILRNIDISLMFQYVTGHRIFNVTRMHLSNPAFFLTLNTQEEAERNYDNGVVQIPFSDMYLENASYLRLENLSVGYTFIPENMKWKGRLRVYMAANNLFTLTGYSGLDPAFNNNSPGLDYFNTYPKSHMYTIGINLEI